MKAEKENHRSRAPHAPATGVSVSIIDSDSRASQLFSDWIRAAEGFSLCACHTSIESALTSLPRENPAIVLIDINLPGLNEFNRARQLEPSLEQIQFTMLLAQQDLDLLFNAILAGATGYVFRRASRPEFLANLRHIHAGGSPIYGELAHRILHSFHNQPAQSTPAAELSPRENRLLRLLAAGSSSNEVAENLHISPTMVSTYVRSIYEKAHARDHGLKNSRRNSEPNS